MEVIIKITYKLKVKTISKILLEYYLNVPFQVKNIHKIGAVENLVYNKNSNTQFRENCQLGYEIRSSRQEKKYSIIAMNTTTRKYSNPYHNTSGSVSSRAHINKKKFRNILAGQRIGKDGYNNCINGQLCSLYMAPGPNTKLTLSKKYSK